MRFWEVEEVDLNLHPNPAVLWRKLNPHLPLPVQLFYIKVGGIPFISFSDAP